MNIQLLRDIQKNFPGSEIHYSTHGIEHWKLTLTLFEHENNFTVTKVFSDTMPFDFAAAQFVGEAQLAYNNFLKEMNRWN